jgi:hypothetical protein
VFVIRVPPVSLVNHPSKTNPERVGTGNSPKIEQEINLEVAGTPVPPFAFHVMILHTQCKSVQVAQGVTLIPIVVCPVNPKL